MGRAVVPEPNVDQATALRQIRDELAALGDIAPYESVRRIRNAWDKVARIKYNASFVQDFLKKQEQATGAAKGTAAMRDALAKTSPETAQANADFALRKAQRDVLQATAETEQGRPIRGTRAFSRGAGMLEGGRQGGVEGAIIGTLVGDLMDRLATSGVTPKIYTARLLTQLADAIRGNQPARAASLRVKLARIATTGEGAAGAAGGASTPRAAGQPQEEERRARR
jgi:hypothetical protein